MSSKPENRADFGRIPAGLGREDADGIKAPEIERQEDKTDATQTARKVSQALADAAATRAASALQLAHDLPRMPEYHGVPLAEALQHFGIEQPTAEELEDLFAPLDRARRALEANGSFFLVATDAELVEIRQRLAACSILCVEADLRSRALALGREDRGILDRWTALWNLFQEWQRKAQAVPPTAAPAPPASKRPTDTGRNGGGEPPVYPHIHTTKGDAALRKIFPELVAAGYIAGTDEDGCEMLSDFLAAFERAEGQRGGIVWSARPQGRIIWKKQARNGAINKAALLDFLYLNGAHDWAEWKKLAAAVFRIELTQRDAKKRRNDASGIYSTECNRELKTILQIHE